MVYKIKTFNPTNDILNTTTINNSFTETTTTHSSETIAGNAVKISEAESTPVTRSYIISEKIPRKQKVRRSTSLYTAQGKRKARAADAITKREDILRLKNFFLYESANDKKAHLRTRNHLLFVLGISSSLRVSDLLNLDIGQVLTRNVIVDPDTNLKEYQFTIKDYIETIDIKTRKSNRIKISSEAKEALKLYFRDYIAECQRNGFPIEPVHPLFQSEKSFANMEKTGLPIRLGNDGVYAILNKAQTKLNLPYHLSTHCLRKTFAYWTMELHPNNANAIAVLMNALNHSSLAATNHYTGRTQEQKDEVFEDISAVFDTSVVEENLVNELSSMETLEVSDTPNDNIDKSQLISEVLKSLSPEEKKSILMELLKE